MKTAAWTQFPNKRAVATVVYTDTGDRVLVVEPVYKPGWELPGGAVEPDESPWQADRREIAEELTLQLSACRLLVLDYSPARPGRIDGLVAVFDGGVLNEPEIAQIRLPADELSSYAFVQASELGDVLPAHLVRRAQAALGARAAGTSVYLDDGHPVTGG